MPDYCEMPTCDNEAMERETVTVSLDRDTVELRRVCHHCSEVFASGSQHGRFRAMRLLLQKAEELSRSGAHTEANCYRLAAGVIDCVDDPAEEVRPSGAVRWRWTPPEPR